MLCSNQLSYVAFLIDFRSRRCHGRNRRRILRMGSGAVNGKFRAENRIPAAWQAAQRLTPVIAAASGSADSHAASGPGPSPTPAALLRPPATAPPCQSCGRESTAFADAPALPDLRPRRSRGGRVGAGHSGGGGTGHVWNEKYQDFGIIRCDTLTEPKHIRSDRLRQFDAILTNPSYSIKQ